MPEHIFDEDRRTEIRHVDRPADDLQYDWSDDMAQITGFANKTVEFGGMELHGIDYENECRRMIEHAFRVMRDRFGNPPPMMAPTHDAAVSYIVDKFYDHDGEAFKNDILQILADGAKDSPTGAQVGASYAHAMLMWQFGWEKYRDSMIEYKDDPAMEELYDVIDKIDEL